MSVYVCLYVCVCMHVCVCMFIYCMYVYVMYVFVYVWWMCRSNVWRMCVYVCMYVCMYGVCICCHRFFVYFLFIIQFNNIVSRIIIYLLTMLSHIIICSQIIIILQILAFSRWRCSLCMVLHSLSLFSLSLSLSLFSFFSYNNCDSVRMVCIAWMSVYACIFSVCQNSTSMLFVMRIIVILSSHVILLCRKHVPFALGILNLFTFIYF